MKLCYAERGSLTGTRAAYALLEHMVKSQYGVPLPEVKKHATGKPYFLGRPDICFSLSHTKTHVLCAVGPVPVGVDIETVRPVRPGVAERVCALDELKAFDFFDLWVLKESFFKLSGQADLPFWKLCFSRRGGAIIAPDASVTARLFDGVPGCRAAVCVRGDKIPDNIDVMDLSKIIADT